jgi:hypothetical protein
MARPFPPKGSGPRFASGKAADKPAEAEEGHGPNSPCAAQLGGIESSPRSPTIVQMASDPPADTSELDIVETGRPAPARPRDARVHPPQVMLGVLAEGGLAPAVMAIIERGVHRRPALARTLQAEVELHLEEHCPPVRIVFEARHVLVEDGPSAAPDLRIMGALADLASLMVAPLVAGLPSPISARGRAALGMVASGRVRIQGRLGVLRRFLSVIRV